VRIARREGGLVRVKVIPVREAIGKPILYVLRRGLKEAQAEGMGAVVIDDAVHVAGGGPQMGGGVKSAINEAFRLG
jgi:hypothetical protein